MTQSQTAGLTTRRTPILTERENQRAVELIEAAERSLPTAGCGSHMLAVAHGDRVWLECAAQNEEKTGLSALISRLTAFSHTRRMIMETSGRQLDTSTIEVRSPPSSSAGSRSSLYHSPSGTPFPGGLFPCLPRSAMVRTQHGPVLPVNPPGPPTLRR